MTEETIQKLKKQFELRNETNRLNNEKLPEAVKIINSFINKENPNNTSKILVNDIEFTDNFLRDKSYPKRRESKSTSTDGKEITQINVKFFQTSKLSNILFDLYYPIPNEDSFYHYTKISSLSKILKGELKLNSLIVNENYEEFKTFYKEHNLLGSFDKFNSDGNDMSQTLMSEIYTFCMASKENLTSQNENSLWNSFGDNKSGVRIEFSVETNHCDFRKIFYRDRKEDIENLLINQLSTTIKNKFNRQLFISGVSKIGMFYLPGSYKIENEVRFAIKKHTDDYKFNFTDDDGFIILPFKSEFGIFKIKKIKIGENCTEKEIEKIKSLLLENGYYESVIE